MNRFARIARDHAFVFLLTICFAIDACTNAEQAVSAPQGRVTDLAKLLAPSQHDALEAQLAAFERETTHQIAVLTVPSLNGQTIEEFSLRVAKAWKLGQAEHDNGILVTLAPHERLVRIELGLGLERFISDDEAKLIIEEAMLPQFRTGNYSAGLNNGIQRLMVSARRYTIRPTGLGGQ
jgi:uncharacterized protein